MSEDNQLLARISQLAGQINIRKTQNPSDPCQSKGSDGGQNSGHTSQPVPKHNGGSWKLTRTAPYARVDRGGRITNPHRNRTLILKQPTVTGPDRTPSTPATEHSNMRQNQEGDAVPASSNWITKRDRHMQLINSNIYDKEAQSRKKAIDNTRRQKALYKRLHEKDQVNRYLRSLGSLSSRNSSATHTGYRVVLEGLNFTVMNGGSKLIRDPDTSKSAHTTPRQANIGGVMFYRSKNGNLYRAGVVEAKEEAGRVKKIEKLCQRFTKTGNLFSTLDKSRDY